MHQHDLKLNIHKVIHVIENISKLSRNQQEQLQMETTYFVLNTQKKLEFIIWMIINNLFHIKI